MFLMILKKTCLWYAPFQEIAYKLNTILIDNKYLMEYDKYNTLVFSKKISNLITRKALVAILNSHSLINLLIFLRFLLVLESTIDPLALLSMEFLLPYSCLSNHLLLHKLYLKKALN